MKTSTIVAQETAAAKAGSFIADAALLGGTLRAIVVTHTLAAELASGETLEVAYAPAGAVFLPDLAVINSDAISDGTGSLGFTGELTALGTTAVLADGRNALISDVGSYKNESRRAILFTVGGGAGKEITDGTKLTFVLPFVVAE